MQEEVEETDDDNNNSRAVSVAVLTIQRRPTT